MVGTAVLPRKLGNVCRQQQEEIILVYLLAEVEYMWRYYGIVPGVLVWFLANEILIDDQERSSLDNKSKETYLSATYSFLCLSTLRIRFYVNNSFICIQITIGCALIWPVTNDEELNYILIDACPLLQHLPIIGCLSTKNFIYAYRKLTMSQSCVY